MWLAWSLSLFFSIRACISCQIDAMTAAFNCIRQGGEGVTKWQFESSRTMERRHGGTSRPGSARPAQSTRRGSKREAPFAHAHDEMLKSLSAVALNLRLWHLTKVIRASQAVRSCICNKRSLSSDANARQEKRIEGGDEGDMHHEKTEHRYSRCWSILLNPSLTSVLPLVYPVRRNLG